MVFLLWCGSENFSGTNKLSKSVYPCASSPGWLLPQDSSRGLWGKLLLGPLRLLSPVAGLIPQTQFSWPTPWLGFLLVIENTHINLFQMPAVAVL